MFRLKSAAEEQVYNISKNRQTWRVGLKVNAVKTYYTLLQCFAFTYKRLFNAVIKYGLIQRGLQSIMRVQERIDHVIMHLFHDARSTLAST